MLAIIISSVLLLSSDPTVAVQPLTSEDSVKETSAAPAMRETGLPSGSPVIVRIDELVSSKTHVKGDYFNISLAEPIMIGNHALVPSGATGRGQVVHASKPKFGGKEGELILAARYVVHEGKQFALRGMQLGVSGTSNATTAWAAGIFATPLPFAIYGGSANVPAGTIATAKLNDPIFTNPRPDASTSPATQTEQTIP